MTPLISEALFEIAFQATLILACTVGVITFILFIIKAYRISWDTYSHRCRTWMKPLVEEYISQDHEHLVVPRFSSIVPLSARYVLQYVLIHRSFGETVSTIQKLASAYEQLGFADSDLKRMRSWFWWVRAEGARCLGQMRIERATPRLLKGLKDRVIEVRLMNAWALGRIGTPEVIPPILESLANASKLAGMRLSSTIFEIGERSIGALTFVCRHPDPAVRLLVAHLLGELRSPMALAEVIHMSRREEDKEVRIAAFKAMGTLGDRKAVRRLIAGLGDEFWEIRAQAAKALGRIGAVESIPHVQEAMRDSAWWVRKNSGEALAEMGEKGRKALLKVQRNSPDRFARDMASQWLDELEFAT